MAQLIKIFQDGGILVWVNLFLLVFALAVFVERFYVYLVRLRIDDKQFMGMIERLVQAGNVPGAIKLCTNHLTAATPRIVRAALGQARSGDAAVAASVEEAILEISPQVTKRSTLLWPIANLATLIGLVGTVFGLIQSFEAVALASPDQKNQLLTQGIAHAMSNTFMGLSVAVVCVFCHIILTVMMRGIIEGMEHASVRIENVLARRHSEGGDTSAPPA